MYVHNISQLALSQTVCMGCHISNDKTGNISFPVQNKLYKSLVVPSFVKRDRVMQTISSVSPPILRYCSISYVSLDKGYNKRNVDIVFFLYRSLFFLKIFILPYVTSCNTLFFNIPLILYHHHYFSLCLIVIMLLYFLSLF